MTLDSRQYAIWQEMVRIFNIEPQTLDGVKIPSVGPTIVPVVDVLTSVAPAFTRANTVLASAVGVKAVATVPDDEYWNIYRMSIQRDSGDRNLSFVALRSPQSVVDCFLRLGNVDSTERATISMFGGPLFLPPASEVIIEDLGGVTNSTWTLVTYRRELPIKV